MLFPSIFTLLLLSFGLVFVYLFSLCTLWHFLIRWIWIFWLKFWLLNIFITTLANLEGVFIPNFIMKFFLSIIVYINIGHMVLIVDLISIIKKRRISHYYTTWIIKVHNEFFGRWGSIEIYLPWLLILFLFCFLSLFLLISIFLLFLLSWYTFFTIFITLT